jgi:hypothetical protein
MGTFEGYFPGDKSLPFPNTIRFGLMPGLSARPDSEAGDWH